MPPYFSGLPTTQRKHPKRVRYAKTPVIPTQHRGTRSVSLWKLCQRRHSNTALWSPPPCSLLPFLANFEAHTFNPAPVPAHDSPKRRNRRCAAAYGIAVQAATWIRRRFASLGFPPLLRKFLEAWRRRTSCTAFTYVGASVWGAPLVLARAARISPSVARKISPSKEMATFLQRW